MNKLVMIFFCSALFLGCEKKEDKLIAVTIHKIHIHGETIETTGWLQEPFTHAIYENIATGERFMSRGIWGDVNDTFKIMESSFK